MIPVLFSIGPFTLYTFGIFVFIACFFGLFVVWKRGVELHFDQKELFDVVFLVLLWMFLGARLGHVLIHFSDFSASSMQWWQVLARPGWYLPMGLLFAWFTLRPMAKKRRWDVYLVSDIFVTGLVLFQALLAFGAFVGGIGYGAPTTWFIGMKFPGVYDNRIPVQIVEFIGFMGLFWYLWWVEGVYRTFSWYKGNRSQALTGFVTGVYLVVAGIIAGLATLMRTPDWMIAGVRMDAVATGLFGIVLGGWVLFHRSGRSIKMSNRKINDSFGLGR
jgi:phosphatidylglycerol:prolipoprotein diacylglycerol transferase